MAIEKHEGKTIMYTAVGAEWRPKGYNDQYKCSLSISFPVGVCLLGVLIANERHF